MLSEYIRLSIPVGCRLILRAFLSLLAYHSSLVIVGAHVTRVGGNKSSWNSSL